MELYLAEGLVAVKTGLACMGLAILIPVVLWVGVAAIKLVVIHQNTPRR